MALISDRIGLGYLPLRHHAKEFETPFLTTVWACRPQDKDEGFGAGFDRFGRVVPERKKEFGGGEETVGDIACATLWPASTRATPAWAFAWPARIEDTGEEPDGGSLSTFSPSASTTQGRQGATALPVRNRAWSQDARFEQKKVALPPGVGSLPKGYPGLVVAGSEEYSQEDLFLPAGGAGLVAVHHAGHPKLGTKVFDVTDQNELDQDRKAPLQCLTRVHRLTANTIPDQEVLKRYYGKLGENSLALQIGIAKHPKDDPKVRGALLADQPGGQTSSFAAFAASSAFNPRQLLGSLSYQLDGPLKVAPCQKHRHCQNEDGDTYGAVHVQTNAFYHRGGETCAPLEFGGAYPQKVVDREIPTRVYLSYDDQSQHPTIFGARKGLWRWWTTTPIYKVEVPPPPTIVPPDPPTFVPPPPPPDPPTFVPPPPPPDPPTFVPPPPPTPTDIPTDGPDPDPGPGHKVPDRGTTGGKNQPGTDKTATGSGLNPTPGQQAGGSSEGPGPTYNPYDTGHYEPFNPYDTSNPVASTDRIISGGGVNDRPFRPNPSLDFYWQRPGLPKKVVPDTRQNATHLPFLATLNELAAPAFLFRPDNLHPSMVRYANSTGWGPREAAIVDSATPVVLRIEAIGRQASPGFNYTTQGTTGATTDQAPCTGRYPGGSGGGTALVTPGHRGGTDIAGESCLTGYGTGLHTFGIHKGVKLGFGTVTVDGVMKGGVDMGLTSSTVFVIRVLTSTGQVGDTAIEIDTAAGTVKHFGVIVGGGVCKCVPSMFGDNHATY